METLDCEKQENSIAWLELERAVKAMSKGKASGGD